MHIQFGEKANKSIETMREPREEDEKASVQKDKSPTALGLLLGRSRQAPKTIQEVIVKSCEGLVPGDRLGWRGGLTRLGPGGSTP